MRCHNVREELVAYIDCELSPMGMHAITAHLDECEGCAAECEKLRKTIEWTHQMKSVLPSEDWWKRLQTRMQENTETEADLLSEVHALRQSMARVENRMDQCLNQPAPAPEVMMLEEVAAYLQISPDAMWNLLDEIPHFQVGYELRFKKTSVDEWIRTKENDNQSDSFQWNLPAGWLDRLTQMDR